jgi:UDP-N-acetyl-D-mannosaminuronate dehydrogenase
MKTETLIIGNGEVGSALQAVLSKGHAPIFMKDLHDLKLQDIGWMHICFPYNKDFIRATKDYITKYKPLYTIIHSTVPVGTTSRLRRDLGVNIWHSPIRGVHPNIAQGILTFPKYIGGEYNSEVAEYFKACGIHVIYASCSENTELAKLLDTTYYGWNIVFCKEVEKMCKKYGADFSMVYHSFNTTYNEGYAKLGMPNVVRPILFPNPGKIGGHCVIPNCKLLKEKVAKIILKFNKKY